MMSPEGKAESLGLINCRDASSSTSVFCFLAMSDITRKRTLDAFFAPLAKKQRVVSANLTSSDEPLQDEGSGEDEGQVSEQDYNISFMS